MDMVQKLPSTSTLAFIYWALEAFPAAERIEEPETTGWEHWRGERDWRWGRRHRSYSPDPEATRAMVFKHMIDQVLAYFQIAVSAEAYGTLLNYVVGYFNESLDKALWHIFYYLHKRFPSVILRVKFEELLDHHGYPKSGRRVVQRAREDIDETFPLPIDFHDALVTRFWDFCATHPKFLSEERQVLGEEILGSGCSPVGDPRSIIGGLIYLLAIGKTQREISLATGCSEVSVRVWGRKLRARCLRTALGELIF